MEKNDKTRLRSSSPLQLQVYLKNIEPHCFVDKKDAARLKESVLKESHRLDLRNSTGLTVLETAVKNDFLEGVETLLSCGANATMINQSTGHNAFHVAAHYASRGTLVALMVHAEFPTLTEKIVSTKERLRLTHHHLKTAQEHLKLAREQLVVLESTLIEDTKDTREEPILDYDAKMSQLQERHAQLLAKHHIFELGQFLTIKDNEGRTPALLAQSNTQLTPDLFDATQLTRLYGTAIISRYLALLQSE
jgi:ankyrin repeat protein